MLVSLCWECLWSCWNALLAVWGGIQHPRLRVSMAVWDICTGWAAGTWHHREDRCLSQMTTGGSLLLLPTMTPVPPAWHWNQWRRNGKIQENLDYSKIDTSSFQHDKKQAFDTLPETNLLSFSTLHLRDVLPRTTLSAWQSQEQWASLWLDTLVRSGQPLPAAWVRNRLISVQLKEFGLKPLCHQRSSFKSRFLL